MSDNAAVYVIRFGDLEETSRLIEEIFGVAMEFVESEVWDDYYRNVDRGGPSIKLKQNHNAFEEERPLRYPEFPNHDFYLVVIDHPDLDAIGRALSENTKIDAVMISRMEGQEVVFERRGPDRR